MNKYPKKQTFGKTKNNCSKLSKGEIIFLKNQSIEMSSFQTSNIQKRIFKITNFIVYIYILYLYILYILYIIYIL